MALLWRFAVCAVVAGHACALVPPLTERIKHVVVLMEENRAYDHLMGWNPRSRHGLHAPAGDSGAECFSPKLPSGSVDTASPYCTTYHNVVNVTDKATGRSEMKKVYVAPDAPYIAGCDPNHGVPATAAKIFGVGADYTNETVQRHAAEAMSGFAEWEHSKGKHPQSSRGDACGVMGAFTPEQTPVLTALAREFAFFDQFFCSVPGPTWPNRLFLLSGTSAGLTETIPCYNLEPGKLFPQRTIFDQLDDADLEWRYYYDDAPWELFLQALAERPEQSRHMGSFFADAKAGTLPAFAFMNPRAGVSLRTDPRHQQAPPATADASATADAAAFVAGSNDMHPDHDVALGEALYKEVYEALRAGPQWNETLFILTFDEHGGFYDHIAPPRPVPPPGDAASAAANRSYPEAWFHFDRGGVRVPTVLASPWLPKGHVESNPPPEQQPTPTSAYELTSIMATVRRLFGMNATAAPLTERDAWAATFEHLFLKLDAPRSDCPLTLPDAPPPSHPTLPGRPVKGPAHAARLEAAQHVNDLQATILMSLHTAHHVVNASDTPHGTPQVDKLARAVAVTHEVLKAHGVRTQADAALALRRAHADHRSRVAQWRLSRADPHEGPRRSASATPRHRGGRFPFASCGNATEVAAAAAAASARGHTLPVSATRYAVTLAPAMSRELTVGNGLWLVRGNASAATISASAPRGGATRGSGAHDDAAYCLDTSAGVAAGAMLGASLCQPSADPTTNRDLAQLWRYSPSAAVSDFTIRPTANASLCVTARLFDVVPGGGGATTSMFNRLTLQECAETFSDVPAAAALALAQSFAYYGAAPGMGVAAGRPGPLYFGAWGLSALEMVAEDTRCAWI